MTAITKHIITTTRIMVMICCLLHGNISNGKQENYFCTVKYKDSITADVHTRILYNNVYIINTNKQPITLLVAVNTPLGWRLLSDEHITLSLAPGEKQILTFAFVKLPDATAIWKPVSIHIQLKNTPDTALYRFYIKASPLSRFKLFSKIDNIEVLNREQKLYIPRSEERRVGKECR